MLSLCRFKRSFRWKRKLPNGIPFGSLPPSKHKCFTRTRVPEYYAEFPAVTPQGAFRLMFLYSSLNSPNDPVAGVALLVGPSGTAAYRLRKRAIWPAKQQPSSPESFPAEIFNLKLRRKELHL